MNTKQKIKMLVCTDKFFDAVAIKLNRKSGKSVKTIFYSNSFSEGEEEIFLKCLDIYRESEQQKINEINVDFEEV